MVRKRKIALDNRVNSQNQKHIWVIGGGRFGEKAVIRLLDDDAGVHITVVDHNADQLAGFHTLPVQCCRQDGVSFLSENLSTVTPLPDWIIPMVPFHLAFSWIERKLLAASLRVVPQNISDDLMRRFPNPQRACPGRFFTSLADFLCPDNCPALDDICAVRQEPRPFLLYDKMNDEYLPDVTKIVIKSHQILPGVGGYKPESLFIALDMARCSPNPIFLATACKCHGVVDLFTLQRPGR